MDVVMPKMGESVSEGTIIKWHKQEGDKIKRDEIIFEISTDKVDTEIPSPADGVLTSIKVKEGDTVEVGTVVAVIDSGDGAAKSSAQAVPETSTESNVSSRAEEEASQNSGEVVNTQAAERGGEAVSREKAAESEAPAKAAESAPAKAAEAAPAEESAQTPAKGGAVIDIAMPKMGESVMEGTIIKWYKKTGDAVKKDETIFEISTDKVDTEVPSPAAGVVAEILVGEQETVEVGTIVARLSTGGAAPQTQAEKQVKEEAKAEQPAPQQPAAAQEEPAQMHDIFAKSTMAQDDTVLEEQASHGSRFYSPLVMNIAKKENVGFSELERIKGTGLEGRVTKKDILAYIENRGKQAPAEAQQPAKAAPAQPAAAQTSAPQTAPAAAAAKMAPVQSQGDVQRIPMDNIRQKIMFHMVNSRDTAVHVTAMLEVDMTKIYNYLKAKKEEIQAKEGVKLTYMAFIADACVKALRQYPLVNSSIDGNDILIKKYINLGIAVSMEPNGLIVPNIKGAGERNITGLARAIADLANRARTRKLTPDDITNGTFTITNYGVFGTIFGTPIINQPESAILGVGALVKKPVVVEVDGADSIAIKPVMTLTLSHDHRIIDGMLGGQFLKFVKDTLEGFAG